MKRAEEQYTDDLLVRIKEISRAITEATGAPCGKWVGDYQSRDANIVVHVDPLGFGIDFPPIGAGDPATLDALKGPGLIRVWIELPQGLSSARVWPFRERILRDAQGEGKRMVLIEPPYDSRLGGLIDKIVSVLSSHGYAVWLQIAEAKTTLNPKEIGAGQS